MLDGVALAAMLGTWIDTIGTWWKLLNRNSRVLNAINDARNEAKGDINAIHRQLGSIKTKIETLVDTDRDLKSIRTNIEKLISMEKDLGSIRKEVKGLVNMDSSLDSIRCSVNTLVGTDRDLKSSIEQKDMAATP